MSYAVPPIPDPPEGWRRPVLHHEPSDKATIPGRFGVKVVGLSFHEHYPASVLDLRDRDGVDLVLLREPENAYDRRAVAVAACWAGGEPEILGHLPRAVAGRIAPEIDEGREWSVECWEPLVQQGYEHQPGLSLELRRA